MLIADSQVHIWAAPRPERPWPTGRANLPPPHKPEPITAESLLVEMKAAGVDRAVLVSPVFEGAYNDVVIAAAQAHPDRFIAMGRLDYEDPASRNIVAALREQSGVRGLRLNFNRPHQRPFLTDDRLDWLWPQAEEAGFTVMMLARQHDMHYVDRIAARHPGLKIAIDHLGLHEGHDEEAFRELDKVLALAKRPNVGAKASCLPLYTTDTYPFRKLHPYIKRVYDAFGPRRVFWGSDLSRLPCPYRQCVTMFTEEMPWLPSSDLELIMGRALSEWLDWDA